VADESPTGTVLVIDDDPAVRRAAERILRRHGVRVLAAADGREGVTLLERERGGVRAVLVDLSMPGFDGAATARELRRVDPAILIVLMSGYLESDLASLPADVPRDGFLQKPFGAADVVAALRAALSADR
jgi:CheY-like chemotaxis protein